MFKDYSDYTSFMESISDIMNIAKQAARQAAKIQLDFIDRSFDVQHKKNEGLVTSVDKACEKAIVNFIRKKYPEHDFIAEEDDYQNHNSDYCWIIDPIDGTHNFLKKLPYFCVSIAFSYKEQVEAGVVYNPISKEFFSALRGKGAYLNDKRIKVSENTEFGQSLLCTGFYYDRGKAMQDNLNNLQRFFKQGILGVRRMGSAALDLCWTACGRFDFYWEHFLHPWDFAAASLILSEAGGKISRCDGSAFSIKPGSIVASNGLIHEKVLAVLNTD